MSDDSHTPQGASDSQHESAPTQGQQVVTRYVLTERGFKIWPGIERIGLDLRESSTADEPKFWLTNKLGGDSFHLTLDEALLLAVQLQEAALNHYQVNDLVTHDPEATTPPVESAPQPDQDYLRKELIKAALSCSNMLDEAIDESEVFYEYCEAVADKVMLILQNESIL